MRQHLAVRRAAARGQRHQQRALEPAAVLVAALEVHVGWPRQLGVARQHRFVARTGVEPDVENVALALERVPPHDGHVRPAGQELLDRPLVPGVGAVLLEHAPRPCRPAPCVSTRLAARRAVDARESARPRRAGARCTSPAGSTTMLKMRSRPQAGNPLHLVVDGVLRRLAQRRAAGRRRTAIAGVAVHADEPLRRGEEDHRVVAAPAVRVLVRERFPMPQPARARAAPPRPSGSRRTRAAPPKSSTVSRKCPPGPIGA